MSIDHKMVIPKQLSHHFVNTRYFREPAIAFMKSGGFDNGGRYTQAPIGSKDWYEYWEEQEKRCLYGYQVGGVKITGRHYFYMNFCPIKRTVGEGKAQTKVTEFAKFWVIDYDWFWYKEIARWGCTPEFAKSLHLWRTPKTLDGGRHLSCLKVRRGGFSYKEASPYSYNFIPKSKTYYMAASKPALEGDAILDKVNDMLEHLNQHTDGWWLKNRQKRGTLYNQKASYIDPADGMEKGFKSEIIGMIIVDPNKARGKDATEVKLEEAGSFKNLKEALGILMPSLKEGGVVTGQASVFGTGGEEGDDIEGLADVFNNPDMYDMLCFENDWEDGYEETECGVFVPYYMANNTIMDSDGNIDIEAGVKFEEEMRDKKRKSKDPKDLDRHIAEFPSVPAEALLRVNSNIYPVAEALAQKQRLLRNKDFKGVIQHGELTQTDKGLEWKISAKVKPVDYYPHKNSDDLTGCITIIEHPDVYKDKKNRPPKGLYFLSVDPYYTDEAKDLTSLFVVKVWRRKISKVKKGEEPVVTPRNQKVAWYVGRPKRLTTVYEHLFKLAKYYSNDPAGDDQIIQSEIAGGGQGIIDHARVTKQLHMLCFDIEVINNKEINKGDKNRSYFMPLSTEDKRNGLTYHADWLRQVSGMTEDGNELWNLHYEYDLGLLDEIINFNQEKNADRISSEITAQFMLKQDTIQNAKKQRKKRQRIIDNFENNPNRPKTIIYKDGEVYI